MKKVVVVISVVIMIASCVLCSCVRVEKKKTLNVLCIGNSFNQDTLAYLPPVLNELMTDYDISYGVCYSGSATLDEQLRWYEEDKAYTVFNYWASGALSWDRMSGSRAKTLKEVLEMKDWDILLFQGNTKCVTTDEDVNNMIKAGQKLYDIVKTQNNSSITLMWNEWVARDNYPYSAENMYTLVSDSSEKAAKELSASKIIPIGTAVQKARLYPQFAELGESEGHNMMYSDNIHIQAGLPALLGAYTTALCIMDYCGIPIDILFRSTWIPTEENVKKIGIISSSGSQMTHGELQGIEDNNVLLIKSIAIDAVNEKGIN